VANRYERAGVAELRRRLAEPRRFVQVVSGPRQSGKTTLVRQALESVALPSRYATADEPTLRGSELLSQEWDATRIAARAGRGGAVLVLDEIQKIPGWSETVKRLWDEDTGSRMPVRLVVLGSAPLLVERGLTESLAGRFEVLRNPHWSFAEMRAAFGFSLDEYVHYGGYPGAAPLVSEPERWVRYVVDSLIETTISRDVLLLTRVDKPALLRRLFELGCRASGQILSYTKMLGQLHDAGNTTTLAHYLELLSGAGMVTGLQKFAGHSARSRGSSPKLQVLNTALASALSGHGLSESRADPERWGRAVESAVGAHLANAAATGLGQLFYWRERNREVDFVFRTGREVTAIEVKTARASDSLAGIDAFAQAWKPKRRLLVGAGGIDVEEFLAESVDHWVR